MIPIENFLKLLCEYGLRTIPPYPPISTIEREPPPAPIPVSLEQSFYISHVAKQEANERENGK